jgi:hypothetical protein
MLMGRALVYVYFEDEPGSCKYNALSLRLGGNNEKA